MAVFASGRAEAACRSGFGGVDPVVAHRRQPASGVRTKLALQAAPCAAALADDVRRLIAEAERDGVRKGP